MMRASISFVRSAAVWVSGSIAWLFVACGNEITPSGTVCPAGQTRCGAQCVAGPCNGAAGALGSGGAQSAGARPGSGGASTAQGGSTVPSVSGAGAGGTSPGGGATGLVTGGSAGPGAGGSVGLGAGGSAGRGGGGTAGLGTGGALGPSAGRSAGGSAGLGSGGSAGRGGGGTAGLGTGGKTAGATGGATGGAAAGGASGGASSGGQGSGGVAGAIGKGGSGGAAARTTFRNPLNTTQGSDPWMVYYDGYYYLAATTWGSTLTMKRGRTVQELKAAAPSVIWQDSNASRCCNMWAPEFYLIDGPNGPRWYHYYTAGDGADLGTQRSHVLESDGLDPRGPYHYQGQLLNYWAIDGSVLQVGSNRYFMFSAWDGPTQNIWVMAMTNPWTVTGNRTLLSAPTYTWERQGDAPVNEGPAALYHDGRTFVTYSASHCANAGYKLGLLELTGANPMTASSWWKSATSVFEAANNAYGPGHNGFFVSPDGTENWLVYHATTNSAGSCWTDRTTRIQSFTWNANGTPNFGSPLPLTTDILAPSGQ